MPSATTRTPPATLAAAALVVLLWASAFVAVRVALKEVSPGQLACARYAVAAAVLGALAVVRRAALPGARDLVRLAMAGASGIAFYNLALNTGQQTVDAGVASLLVNTVPIFTALLSVSFLRERINRIGWLGTGVSFTGVALIGLHRSGWSGFDAGVLAILAAALAQALYFVLIKPLLTRTHPLELTSWAVWFGALFLLPFGAGLPAALRASSGETLGAILFLGIGPAALAYVAWSYVLARLPPGRASSVLYLVPVVAIACGALVLGERPSWVALLGGAIAIAGVMLSRRGTAAPRTEAGGQGR